MRDGHLYRALRWKLVWSYKRKWFPILVCTLIPILLALLLAWTFTKLPPKIDQNATKPTPLGSDYISSLKSMSVGYSPENDATKAIMDELKKKISNGTIKSGNNEREVEKSLSKGKKGENEKFGIVFKEASKSRLSYSLRSTESGWFTTKRFKFSQSPPSASSKYFSRGFIALQSSINSAYLKYLGVKEEKFSMQEFPYPAYAIYPGYVVANALLMVFIILGLFPLMFYLMNNVLKEKTTGAKELMILNGLKLYLIYAYWIVFFMILFIIAISVMVVLFKIKISDVAINSDGFLLWLLLILYAFASITLIFVFCSFLSNFSFASTGFLLLTMVIYIASTVLKPETISFVGIISIFIPIGALYHGLELILAYESTGDGFGFSDIVSTNNGYGPYLLIIFALIISAILYLLLAIYISLIKPGEYGKAKPWHFILPRFAKNILKIDKGEDEVGYSHETPTPVVEPVDGPGEIQVRNLYKVYKSFYALNNFSIDIYGNQITALLGHNGAGKSTFLFTITGLISPTSGEIIYEDYNIFTDMERFRESFGFCPQQNIVLEDLSAKENVMFFSMLKKIDKNDADEIADDFFEKFDMADKSNLVPKKMSGGMKRKLCLAIAVANNPPIVFLDEPSSGLDPESRRNFWDIILSLREGRTIVITTHFMEEANVLGDRIAIMAHGELKCYGSAMFLKKHYGYGHNIMISYNDKNPEKIKTIVLSHINTDFQENQSLKQISFNVPMENTSKLSILLSDLTKIVERDQINVTSSSLEKVFLKVNESEGVTTTFEENDVQYLMEKREKNSGCFKMIQHYRVLLYKRSLCLRYSWLYSLIMFFLIPILGTIFTFLLLKSVFNNNTESDPPLELNLNKYGGTQALVGGDQTLEKNFQNQISKSGSSPVRTENDVSDELMKIAEKNKGKYANNYVVAGEFGKSSTIFYSSFAYHSAPIVVNVYYNSYLEKEKSGASIEVTNHPYDFAINLCRSPQGLENYNMIWIFFATILIISLACFTTLPTKERVSGVKHLQNMAGVDPVTYWVSNLMFDLVLYTVILAIIIFIVFVMNTSNAYSDSDILGCLFILLFCFSLSVILLCYFFSLIFKSPNASSTIIVFGLAIIALIFYLLPTIFPKYEKYFYLGNIINTFGLVLGGLNDIYKMVIMRYFCKVCPTDGFEDECKDNNDSLFKSKSFVTRIYWLLGNSALMMLLILLVDYKIIQYPFYKATNAFMNKSDDTEEKEDDDVHNEKQKVKNYLKDKKGKTLRLDGGAGSSRSYNSTSRSSDSIENLESPLLLVDELTKKYRGNFVAAKSVSFAAHKGECFGLLGVSGAGKSTVFGMLSGTKFATKGSAYIIEEDQISQEMRIIGYGFVNKNGYCPQEHCLIDQLSARQLMTIFANLRGTKEGDVDTMVEWWINMLDLHNYADKPCGNYSGGNKRKLSTALALIGQPILILMDEPTTGVDPIARRKLWQIFNLIKYTEQTMILTSHSMDECEAVCNRLTIMAKGKMMCIGDVNYLKHKFALGCTIYLKLYMNAPTESVDNLKNVMISKFGPTLKLTDEYQGFLHYQLGDRNIKWEEVFSIMEKIKTSFEILEEYMMSDTTLEQVFLSFTKNESQQEEE